MGDAAIACSACGHASTSGAKFCGAALADQPPRPEHERGLSRYVPETLLRKMRAARGGSAMRGERRTVTKQGDALLAFFGAPIAREDDRKGER